MALCGGSGTPHWCIAQAPNKSQKIGRASRSSPPFSFILSPPPAFLSVHWRYVVHLSRVQRVGEVVCAGGRLCLSEKEKNLERKESADPRRPESLSPPLPFTLR
ncbi:hypothetical protein L2E82_31935 [Cichorium intybus]|uniref:Uncharacterized protein n=1 Tax=Cichorium intybus TaxID=13427 RepID=A0ACB9BFB7_CICIN|nr:hypothetical protein L2E82_31935 [Cichorium intybus]